jgi:hypothetical protein
MIGFARKDSRVCEQHLCGKETMFGTGQLGPYLDVPGRCRERQVAICGAFNARDLGIAAHNKQAIENRRENRRRHNQIL